MIKTEFLTRGVNKMKTRLLTFILSSVIVLSASVAVFAATRERSETVGHLAWTYLDPDTRAKISQILGPEESLANAASWLNRTTDLPYPKNRAWHYLHLPLDCASYQACDGFTRDDDIVHIINTCIRTLQGNPDPYRPLSEFHALRILAHLVADIHEPLGIGAAYVAYQEGRYRLVRDPVTIREKKLVSDNGGRRLLLTSGMTLRKYWDDRILSSAGIGGPSAFARYLRLRVPVQTDWTPEDEINTWAAQWASESLEIARDHSYKSVTIVRRVRVSASTSSYVIRRQHSSQRARDERVVAEQLMKAGFRLASLLNAIYRNQPMPVVNAPDRLNQRQLDPKPNRDWRRVLAQEGPQFPIKMEDGAVSMIAFVEGGWQMVVELEEEVDIEVTIKALDDNRIDPFVKRLRTRGNGPAKKASVQLPTSFGNKPFPALITILPAGVAPGAQEPEPFHFRGLGLGLKTDGSMFNVRDNGLVSVSYLTRNDSSPSRPAFPQSEQVEITISPDTINTSGSGSVIFSFYPKNTFKRWAADFRSVRYEVKGGRRRSTTVWVRTDTYDEEVTAGSKIDKKWDGYDAQSKPSIGENKLIIRAWFSAASGGPSAVRVADQVIKVK
jgi:hypothetical protein